MKYIYLLLLVASSQLFAADMQILAQKDKNGAVTHYIVRTWNGEDSAMIDTKYTIAEAQAKFPQFLTKSEAGTSKNPDRIFLNYDSETGALKSVEFQATGPFEPQVKSSDSLSAQAKTEAVEVKTDIEAKTGKPVTKTKVDEPIIEVSP